MAWANRSIRVARLEQSSSRSPLHPLDGRILPIFQTRRIVTDQRPFLAIRMDRCLLSTMQPQTPILGQPQMQRPIHFHCPLLHLHHLQHHPDQTGVLPLSRWLSLPFLSFFPAALSSPSIPSIPITLTPPAQQLPTMPPHR